MFESVPDVIIRDLFITLDLLTALNFSATCKTYRRLLLETLEYKLTYSPIAYPCKHSSKCIFKNHSYEGYRVTTRYSSQLTEASIFNALFGKERNPIQARLTQSLNIEPLILKHHCKNSCS